METNIGCLLGMNPGFGIFSSDSIFFWIVQGNDTMELGYGPEWRSCCDEIYIDCISDTLTIIGDVGVLHCDYRYLHFHSDSAIKSLTVENHSTLEVLSIGESNIQSLKIRNCLKLSDIWIAQVPHLNEVLLSGELPRLRGCLFSSCPSLWHLDLSSHPPLEELHLSYTNIQSLDISPVASVIRLLGLDQNQLTSCAIDDIFRSLPVADSTCIIGIGDNPGTYTCRDSIALNKGWVVYKTGHNDVPNTNFTCVCNEPNRPDFSKEIDLSVESGKWFDLSYSADNTAVWVVNGSDTLVKRSTDGKTGFGFRTQSDTVKVLGKCSVLNVSHNESNLTRIGSRGHTTLRTLSVANNNIDRIDLRNFPNLVEADLQHNCLDRVLFDSTSSLRKLSLQGNRLNDCCLDALFTLLPRIPNGNEAGKLTVAQDGFGNPGIFGCRTYEANDRGWNVYANGSVLNNTEFSCVANFPVPNHRNRLDFSVVPNTTIHCVFRFSEHGTLEIINGADTSLLNFSSGQQKETDLVTTGTELSFIGNLSYLNMTVDRYNRNIKALHIGEHGSLEELYLYEVGLRRASVNHCDKLKKLDVAKNNINYLFMEVCPALEVLLCYKNALAACGLDTLYHKLPVRTGRSAGKVYVEDNPEYTYSRDTIAYNKNWHVIGPYNTPIHNESYSCAYFTVGLNAPMSASRLVEIFPNPVKEQVYITAEKSMEKIEIFNLFGQSVFSAEPGSKYYSLDAAMFPAGCYIVKVFSGNRWSVCRILIE